VDFVVIKPLETKIHMTEKINKAEAEGFELGQTLAKTWENHTGWGLQGVCKDVSEVAEHIGWSVEKLTERVTAFHAERLAAVPEKSKFPELYPYTDVLAARYKGMKRGGMTDGMIAINESYTFWKKFFCEKETGVFPWLGLGRKRCHCRCVYAPETDRGAMETYNWDDALTAWVPKDLPSRPRPAVQPKVTIRKVSNGLHYDSHEPALFPAQVFWLIHDWADSVDAAVELYTRYHAFWDDFNVLAHDDKGYAVALDKPGRGIPVLRQQNDGDGIVFVNGQSGVDESVEAYVREQRRIYLEKSKQAVDSYEGVYFKFSENVRANMLRRMAQFRTELTSEALIGHITSGDPDGPLCKRGTPCHPDDNALEATVLQSIAYWDENRIVIRQWEKPDGKWIPVWEQPWLEV